MNFDETIISAITAQLKNYDSVEKAVLFGSRARGDNSERSDYDIAIYGNVPYSVKGEIRYFCSETLWTLHKIDLVFVDEKTYPKLKDNIEKEGVLIYAKNR